MRNNVSRLPVPYARRPVLPALEERTPVAIAQAIRGPAMLGGALIALFIGGFAAWSMLAPIASGAVASGVISPDGSRRTVQHLEGGIIAAIKAHDGDYVEMGQPVMVLQSLQATAVTDSQREEYLTLLASQARLYAELTQADTVAFPVELLDGATPQTAAIVEGQRAIFDSSKTLLASQKQVLVERMEQLDAQITAFQAQMASATEQIDLIQQDLDSKQSLLAQGLVTAPQVLTLQRQQAELDGQMGQYQSGLAEIGQKRGELQSQLLSLEAEQANKVAADYDATRVALSNANEKLNVSEDILNRTVVTAPVSGRVVNSRFMSPGGVVMRGEPIMDIVPSQERLLIDARISVLDIDIVHTGMKATIHLSALATFSLPRIEGEVVSVSADRIIDSGTGQAYYLARVEVSPESLKAIGDSVELVPGMPAEVLIVTSERTMAQYLIEPLQATFRRSFHET